MIYQDAAQWVEFMVEGHTILFRLLHQPNPRTFLQVAANVELGFQGRAWHPVPSHMMSKVPKKVLVAANKEA